MGEIVVNRNGIAHLYLVERNSRTIKSAVLSQELLADDSVNVKVESKTALDLKINDYIFIDGLTYRLNQLPSVTKNSENNFEYDLIFQGLMFDLKRCKFFNADINDFKTELEFPLIGDLEFFLTVVRNNMRRFSVDWEVGNFPTNTETKSLTFSSDNCLSALQKICQEYKVEFWIKQENGKFKIHTGAFGNTLPITLEYGKGNGLYSLSRKNVNENDIVSRLYVNGGSTNIPNEYRGFSKNLLLPNSAYLEDTALIKEIGLIEGSITFEDIYPKRTGVISALGNSVFKFVDSSMDFDLNEKEADGITTKYLISGTSAKIHFNTGNLAGYQFEIKKGGYTHATKTFEIIPFTNEQGQKFPDENSQAFQFSVGDEYKILDIYMPQSYITNAENELLAKATEQFNLLKQPKVAYDLEVDSSFISSLSTPISIGDYVRVKDSDLGVDKVLRVQSISKNLITDEVESIVIADAYEVNYASKLILDIKEIKNVVNITKLGEINYSKLGLKTTEELKNLVFDTDGYFDAGNIKPFSIETNMLSVGSRSQQLSLSSVFRINQDGNANKIDVTAGVLFSQTLDKTWNVSALVSTISDNDYRYVYAKASKTTSAASIYLSKNQIPFDSDVNDFYFLVGILHSVVDGVRVLSITIGTTTISGGLVRTGIISSLDGTTTFNLNTGEIKGKITFSSGSSGYNNLTDKPDLSSFEATRDYVNSTLQTDLADLKNRADGVIESWFYSHTPTLNNLPASNWTTDEERNKHIGDTFTNMQEFVDNATTPDAGKAWRFVKNETTGEFSWSLIANSDSTKALIEAGKAKDTADAKRRVFVSEPYPPYNVGDLWVQGNNGDIMRCKFERLSGTYVASDFEKASKYTDDTAVNNLQIGGRNLLRESKDIFNNSSYWGSDNGSNFSFFEGGIRIEGDTYPSNGRFYFRNKVQDFIIGETYTVSFEVYGNRPFGVNVGGGSSSPNVYFSPDSPSAWKKYNFTFVWSGDYGYGWFYFTYQVSGTNYNVYRNLKIERGSKATDWTPAPEDVDSAISTAQNSANTANSLLSEIANDNVLSPSEKQSTKKEWDIIVGEKPTVEWQASSLGVPYSDYTNAYNALSSYITPLLADLTTKSTIVGDTFRANFKSYYNAKINLLKAVTDKLKSNTDNVQVGGRNFALDTKNKTLNLTANGSIAYSVSQDFKPNARNKYVTLSAYFEGSYVYATGGHYGIDARIVYSDGSSEWIGLTRGSAITESTAGTIVGARYSKTYKLKDLDVTAVDNLTMFIRGMSSVSKFIVKDYKLEFGNRATDYTPAPEDLDNAISTAQTSANTANSLLADIANDNVLSPSEKQSTKKEWDIIASEKTTVETQATSLGVSATLYNSAYNSLNTYITPLLADLTTNSTIDGATFRAKFKAYYDAKISLLKDVTDKLKANTDNIQIGGRNLIVNYDGGGIIKLYGVSGTKTIVQDSTLPSKSFIRFSNIQREVGNYVFFIHLLQNTENIKESLVGKEINVSFYARANNSQRMYFERNSNISVNLDTTWKKMSFPWVYDLGNFHFVLEGSGLTTLEIHSVKIEYGNKATDWTPSPEDVDNKITAEAQKIIALENKTNFLGGTTIDGNVVATGTMLVGNADGTNAGLTGIGTEDEIFLWGGSTFANRNNAKVWLKRNGHFRFMSPNGLSFDSQTGTITNRYLDTAGNPLSLFIGTNALGNPEMTFYDRSGNITFRMNPNGIDFPNEVPESWTAVPLKSAGNTIARPLDSTTREQMIDTIKSWVCYDETMGIYAIKSIDLIAYDYFAGRSAYSEGYRQYEGLKTSNNSITSNIADGWYYNSSDQLMTDFATDEPLVELFYIRDGKKVYSEALKLPKHSDYLYISCN